MNFMELVKSRRSTRAFIEKDVDDSLITQLLEAAQAAPSGGNRQPWHFYVIRDKSVISDIVNRVCKQDFIATAPVLFVVCADITKSEERYGERGRSLYCLQDTAAAIQNILLCAEYLKLSTCWCGSFDEAEMQVILNVKKDMRPVAIIPIGFSSAQSTMPKRRPIEEITTFI